MAVPDLPIAYRLFAHHDCLHNQLVSIHNRVCGKVPEPDPATMERFARYMGRLADSVPKVTPMSLDEVVESYTGTKRTRYAEAAHEYRSHGLTQDQAWCKMFIKTEKIRFVDGAAKRNPDPRAIQYRNPVFAVVFAQYIKAIEKVFYKLAGNRLNGLPPTRMFGKGLNSNERAKLFSDKWKRFDDPVGLPIDLSRMDQHIGVRSLQILHSSYLRICYSTNFQTMCSWTIRNRVTSSRGIKYQTLGGRMSGDMDTGLGATALMGGYVGFYFHDKGIKWDAVVDGDDAVVIVERSDYERVARELPAHFASLGQEAKIEEPVFKLEDVVWCQSSIVQVDGVEKFIRNPAKVLSGALVGQKWIQMASERSKRALCNTIGLGEAHLNKGIPVLQSFGQALIRCANTKRQVKMGHNESLVYKVRHEFGKSWEGKMPDFAPAPVTDDTRNSFAQAFGISVTEQLQYEEYLDNWEINFQPAVLQGPPVDVARWVWEEYDYERY